MAETYPHIVRPPCPQSRSTRTIQTASDNLEETLYCPDCGHIWDVPRA